MGIRDFKIVTEDVVVPYLERRDPGPFHFPFPDLLQVILSRKCNVPEFVEMPVHPLPHYTSFIDHCRRVGIDLRFDPVADGFAEIKLFAYLLQSSIRGLFAFRFYFFNGVQRIGKLYDFPGADPVHCRLGDQPFQVSCFFQQFFYCF